MVNLFSYSRWVFGISAGSKQFENVLRLQRHSQHHINSIVHFCHVCLSTSVFISTEIGSQINLFTHVSDPNGHSLIEEVEDHDDDEVDAGGSDGSC